MCECVSATSKSLTSPPRLQHSHPSEKCTCTDCPLSYLIKNERYTNATEAREIPNAFSLCFVFIFGAIFVLFVYSFYLCRMCVCLHWQSRVYILYTRIVYAVWIQFRWLCCVRFGGSDGGGLVQFLHARFCSYKAFYSFDLFATKLKITMH